MYVRSYEINVQLNSLQIMSLIFNIESGIGNLGYKNKFL